MKKADVPQENSPIFQGGVKAVYATDEQGRYVVATTTGWKAEEIVTSMAVEDFQRMAAEARARVEAGASSPLEYHMYAQRMDVGTLASTAGRFQWTVRRHFRPDVFARLDDRTLARYADALGIPVAQLRELPR